MSLGADIDRLFALLDGDGRVTMLCGSGCDGTVDGGPNSIFCEFCLEDRIPPNHLLRRIKVFVSVALTLERRGVENVPTGTL